MGKSNWIVVASYDANYYNTDIDKDIESVVGFESSGSGLGFGRRDMDWYLTEEEKDKVLNLLQRIKNQLYPQIGLEFDAFQDTD